MNKMAADVHSVVSTVTDNLTLEWIKDSLGASNCVTEQPDVSEARIDSIREYSPQHSPMVHVLTDLDTPSGLLNVNNDRHEQFSQNDLPPSQLSDFTPNQTCIAMLDQELDGLPRDSYIQKLIELTHESENVITWYRTLLLSRARDIEGCPLGQLINRKSTNVSTSIEKYARDCFMLSQFCNGNKTSIEEIFRKDDKPKQSVGVNNTSVNASLIELRATLQSALQRISDLEKRESTNENAVKTLKCENEKLKSEIHTLTETLEECKSDYKRKLTQYDSNFKLLNQQIKHIGDFDFVNCTESIKSLEKDSERHNKILANVNKSIADLRVNCQKSYAEKVAPKGTPTKVDINSQQGIDEQTHPPNSVTSNGPGNLCNGQLNNGSSEGESGVSTHTEGPPYRDQEGGTGGDPGGTESQKLLRDEKQNGYRIPVRCQGVTEPTIIDDENCFRGVIKHKTARYYIAGIHPNTTRTSIIEFLEERGVHCTYLKLFKKKEGQRTLSAKLNINKEHVPCVEKRRFWPSGVFCREWLSNQEWNQRCYDEGDYNKTDYDK